MCESLQACQPRFPVRKRHPQPKGFALVVSLSLMLMLTVLAVGLLSLSAISLRASGAGQEISTARHNARLAMMLAIAELQKQTGPDTRITARADILGEDRPPVLGAWKSWEGTNHDAQGRPAPPRSHASAKQARFLGWLTSASQSSAAPAVDPPNTTRGPAKATLIGPRTLGNSANSESRQIHLEPTLVNQPINRGGFAWWIGGENQKARLPKPHEPSADSPGRWAARAKSYGVADPSVFGLDDLLSDPKPAHLAISLKQGDLLQSTKPEKLSSGFFHDLSASSVGLLTNTATGGWRKDLSLFTENWDSLPASNLPTFQVRPGQDLTSTKPTSDNAPAARSMLYPWSAYRGSAGNIPIYQHGAVASWHNLKDYATAYKRMSGTAAGRAVLPTFSIAIDDTGQSFDFLHRLRVLPVIARMQWVFSHSAAPIDRSAYQPRLLVTPVITMWNPYNVEITASDLTFIIPRPLPTAFKYYINGTANTVHHALMAGSTNYPTSLSPTGSLRYAIPTFTLKAGETRVFSPAAGAAVEANQLINLQQGYRSGGGHFFPVRNNAGATLSVSASTTIKADVRFDTTYNDVSLGVGIYLDMLIGGRRHLAYRMVFTPQVANQVYKPLEDLASTTLLAASTNPAPFFSSIFGARMASNTHIAAKGFLQSSPLVNYTAMGSKDQIESTIARKYGGTSHPVNSPFDYSFIRHAAAGDSYLPNASDTSGRGYIVTGFSKADGLSRCVIAEIPTRPLHSLAELQNWDLRYENPIPPYALNLIGNSSAPPLLPANAVVNTADAGLAVNLQHDDSYCANHLLFDDWFFSSICPDPTHFGSAIRRDLRKTFTDFITGEAPLANHAYRPIVADSANATAATATALFSAQVNGRNSWRTIASRLEVEGMFNVNSTSVPAWRALLGHARNQRVPFISESGASWRVDTSEKSDHPVSRFTIAGDVEAKSQGSSGAFPDCAEVAGYRLLDEKTLDQLAENVVAQIRTRGPFLSLAEFINRQLSSGDLALAGTLQAALDTLAKSQGNNLYATLKSFGQPITVPRDAEYQFPAAAAGDSTFGLPGWPRQADILRPIAPILSARDDTFVIRAYGDARDLAGNIKAVAVCEVIVRRTRDMVDPIDAPDATGLPTSPVNQRFGRRYQTVSFRWLNADEI